MKTRAQTAEAELLLVSIDAASAPSEKSVRIGDLLRRGLDWTRLTRMTMTHRLVPMVCRNFNSKPDSIPIEAFAGLRFSYWSNVNSADQCTANLIRLIGQLKAIRLTPLVLKGPALSLLAYGDISTRQYFDLDILVHPFDVVRAAEVLISAGYRGRTYERKAFESGFFRNTSDEFSSESGICLVDLRWKISDWYFPFGPDEHALWSRTETVNLKGHDVRTLGAADHLLFLCAHASKHGWPDLLSVADIAALLRARPALDLRAAIEEAERLHFERMVLVGLLLAHRLAHAALPEDVLALINKDSAVTALGERISARLLAQSEALSELERWSVMLRTIDRPRDRLRVLLSLGLIPTGGDHSRLPLPRSLYPLYYLVRPFRLIGTGAAMMARRATRRIVPGAATMDDAEAVDTLN